MYVDLYFQISKTVLACKKDMKISKDKLNKRRIIKLGLKEPNVFLACATNQDKNTNKDRCCFIIEFICSTQIEAGRPSQVGLNTGSNSN
ncbi:hypothetical protein BpHYR1_030764 [Brachionus plicatilis]|uniref:Uncharacterized protein n=1 Tax=Brachionus plicatilis TaxID=10195 RepID=A0A3M7PV44_BRAPC|nr:hypothetical protein BpHYR1_030764 [Brachionus plicatilis]